MNDTPNLATALAAHNRAALDSYRRMLEIFFHALDHGRSVQAEFAVDESGPSCVFRINRPALAPTPHPAPCPPDAPSPQAGSPP